MLHNRPKKIKRKKEMVRQNKGRDPSLLYWQDWPLEALHSILSLAQKVKKKNLRYSQAMLGKSLIMLFQKSSTRTRVSFEVGMSELGGHAVYLDWASTNFRLSKIYYEAVCLSQNAAILMARMKRHEDLLELDRGARVPVINGCCNRYHPCQAMADMLTIYEDRGFLEGTKLAYVGVHNNIANSLMEVAYAFGVELSLVCPLSPEGIADIKMKEKLLQNGLLIEGLDVKKAVDKADYVYTDTWVDLEFFDSPDHAEIKKKSIERMLPYQINAELMKDSAAKIMHDMPIHPGYEISAEMVESPRSLIFHQAANRLPVQKAIILYILGLQ